MLSHFHLSSLAFSKLPPTTVSASALRFLPILPALWRRGFSAMGSTSGRNCSSVEKEGALVAMGGKGKVGGGLSLEELNWDHSFVRELPGDTRTDTIPRQVLHACYSKVSPSVKVENPKLVVWSDSVTDLLNLDKEELSYAQCYGGHQFGSWAGQLGDGRAITLGEILNSKSER